MDQQRRVEKKNKIKTLGTERLENIKNLYINKIISYCPIKHVSTVVPLTSFAQHVMVKEIQNKWTDYTKNDTLI